MPTNPILQPGTPAPHPVAPPAGSSQDWWGSAGLGLPGPANTDAEAGGSRLERGG